MKGIATLAAYLAAEKTFLLGTTILETKVWGFVLGLWVVLISLDTNPNNSVGDSSLPSASELETGETCGLLHGAELQGAAT